MVADNGNEFQKQMIKAAFWENQGVQRFLVFSLSQPGLFFGGHSKKTREMNSLTSVEKCICVLKWLS